MPIEDLIFGGIVGLAALVVAVVAYRNRQLPIYENQHDQYNDSDQPPVFRRITYSRNDRLRLTNNTASIYKGKFEEKVDVALKRVKICRNDAVQIDTDLAILLKRLRLAIGVNHGTIREGSVTNIVKFFCYEFEIGENTLHLLLALELCDCNLDEYIQSRHNYPRISNKEIISQILFWLQYLHSRQIVHGNIKPSNILLQQKSDDELLFKFSDFGLLKLHGQTENGTVDWLAPEIYDMRRPGLLDLERSFWQRSDIFSLGLIFYFIVSDGHDVFRSQDDIQRGNADYTHVDSNKPFLNLLTRMLKPKPDDRPFTQAIMKHPALWSCEKNDFFYYASNLLMERSISQACTIENNQCFKRRKLA
jgi:serine/threonine protein kinase